METSGFTGPAGQRPEQERPAPDQDSFFVSLTPSARHAQPADGDAEDTAPAQPTAQPAAAPAADDFFASAPAPAPAVEPAAEPEAQAAPEAPAAPAEPEPAPVAEPPAAAAPAPTPEPVAEPVVEAVAEPVAEAAVSVPEPVVEAAAEPVAAPVAEQTPSEPAPAVLLVEDEPPAAPSDFLGQGLPMSLSIAAEEAAQVDIEEEPEAPSRGLEGVFDERPAAEEAAEPVEAVVVEEVVVEEAEPAPQYDFFYSADGEAKPDPYGEPVGLAEAEIDDDAYTRSTTEPMLGGEDIVLADLLIHVLENNASDLHLTAGARPTVRINGHLEQLKDYPVLTPPVIQRIMYAAITQRQRELFESELELDFAYAVPGRARFRVNMYRQRDAIGAAFRLIPFEIKRLEDLGVPPQVANFANMPRGLILVTGPTGSGKSTTLASIIDLANRTRHDHIMTCEDPIEFLHRHQQCIVNQREVGEDTLSFGNALKHVLRQDPDIILVGEMRDLETISIALTAAETGHLVFATLHTQDAAQTIDRMIDVFPPHQQQQVRTQLAGAIQGVVCQTLCRTADGKGRVVAVEVMIATPAVRNLIREGKTHQIYSAMQAGAKYGMQTMDQHLADLFNKGRITYDVGLEKCHHVEDFNRLTGRG